MPLEVQMRKPFLGDSYDIVKQSFLRWLRNFGSWSVHPMFTEAMLPADIAAFESLLEAPVISAEVLTVDSDRAAYFAAASRCGHLFLDPDTGLRMRATRGVRAPQYLFGAELRQLAEQRRSSLTAVYDQSVARGSEGLHLEGKLRQLRREEVFGFAYRSHACFIVASCDRDLVVRARSQVIAQSRLPENRFLPVDLPD
jgi:hypothetical protein